MEINNENSSEAYEKLLLSTFNILIREKIVSQLNVLETYLLIIIKRNMIIKRYID